MGDTFGNANGGALATTTSFDYSIYNAIYWLIFLMMLSWLLRLWARCRHVHTLWTAVRKQQVVRLDAGFEIRSHEMTRATLQALLKNHSRYDIRAVTKYRPAAHVVRDTARLVPISVEPASSSPTVISDSNGSPALISFASSPNGHDDHANGRIGDYHLQMRMAIGNPVMVHVYMGVPLSCIRHMWTKYDLSDNDNGDGNNGKAVRKNASDMPSSSSSISSVPGDAKHSSINITRVAAAAHGNGTNGTNETKVGEHAPLFAATEYLFTRSLKVTPVTNLTDVTMTLPRDWFVRCLSSTELAKRHPFVLHIVPLADSSHGHTGGSGGHHSHASAATGRSIVNSNVIAVSTPSAAMAGATLGSNTNGLTANRPVTPSLSHDHDVSRTPQPSPPSTPFGWDSPHATASELILVTFPPLPAPPSSNDTPTAAPATAAAAAAGVASSGASSAVVLVATPPSTAIHDDTKVMTAAEQAIATSFDIQVSRAKFDRQLLLADSLLFDIQEIFGLNEESLDCSICMSNPRDIVLLPCRHCCVCATCHTKTDKCPVCRAAILNYMQFDATPIAARLSQTTTK